MLLLALGVSALAHPMDEWFTEMHWTTGKGLRGRFRVPADQRARLAKQPIVFSNGADKLTAVWTDAGKDENGRVLVELTVATDKPTSEISITLPEGLMDDNQSLVGFLAFDEGEPTTVMVPAGQTRSVSAPSKNAEGGKDSAGLSVFFKFGLKHILEGYDHLLFLFCLLIAGGTLRHLAIVVTAFTLGHSITLALSVLGLVSLPTVLTESLIAFSIVVAALANLRAPKEGEERKTMLSRGIMAGAFGLIHGLGFASMLTSNGLSGSGVVAPLVGFNLGVEAGQLGLVLLFYPFIYAIHRSRHSRTIVVSSSVMAACCGLFWLLERLGVITING